MDTTGSTSAAETVQVRFAELLARYAAGRGVSRDGYRSPKGRHRHRCPQCRTVWEHADPPGRTPPAEAQPQPRPRHACPRCRHAPDGGRLEKYDGPLPPSHHEPSGPVVA